MKIIRVGAVVIATFGVTAASCLGQTKPKTIPPIDLLAGVRVHIAQLRSVAIAKPHRVVHDNRPFRTLHGESASVTMVFTPHSVK
jgi:hypothetical protein